MKRAAQLLLSLSLGLILFLPVFQTTVSAQTSSYPLNTNSDVPDNSHTRVQVLFLDISTAILCQLIEIDIMNPQRGCLGFDHETQKIGYVQADGRPKVGGILGSTGGMIASLYTPPASGTEYVRYLANNFGITKPAHAQDSGGTGFSSLNVLRDIWVISRNLAFIILVIIFILLGIAIMLRLKIDPRTVMTIQNQLPKIIVTIILITFSYSIVGFMIDLMWTGTYFTINTLSSVSKDKEGNYKISGNEATKNLYTNPIYYMNRIVGEDKDNDGISMPPLASLSWNVGTTIGDTLSRMVLGAIGLGDDLGCGNGGIISKARMLLSKDGALECFEYAVFGFIKYVVSISGLLIVVIALLISLFKLWFSLIKAYIYVLLYTIIAPIYLLFGLFPGSQVGFSAWIRRIVSHLIVFPAAVGLLLLAGIFIGNVQLNDNVTKNNAVSNLPTVFVPPLINNPNINDNLGYMIGFGFILLAPSILDLIKDAFSAHGNPKASSTVIGGFMAGAGAGMAIPKSVWGGLNKWDPQNQAAGVIGAFTHRTIPNNLRRLPLFRRFQTPEQRWHRNMGRNTNNPTPAQPTPPTPRNP